jgi:hypothetical protein
MRGLLDARGIPLLVVVFPIIDQVDETLLALDREYVLYPQARLAALCRDLGLPLFDFAETILGHGGARLFADHLHLSPEGNDLVARELTVFLQSELAGALEPERPHGSSTRQPGPPSTPQGERARGFAPGRDSHVRERLFSGGAPMKERSASSEGGLPLPGVPDRLRSRASPREAGALRERPSPLALPGRLTGRGEVVDRTERTIRSRGELLDDDGNRLASAEATLRILSPTRRSRERAASP